MSKLKESVYNYHFRVSDRNFIFNCKENGLIEIDNPNLIDTPEYFDELIKQGYLIDNESDEFTELMKEVDYKVKNDFFTLDITLSLTEKCNFNCIYCYQTRNPNEMTINDANKLLDQVQILLTTKKYKELKITYFGGEPLMNYEILLYLDDKFKMMCDNLNILYLPYIVTNGYMLDNPNIIDIKFEAIQITIEGMKETHNHLRKSNFNSFDKIILNLDNIIDKIESRIIFRINLCKENSLEAKDLIKYLAKRYFKYLDRISFAFAQMEKHSSEAEFQMLSYKEYSEVYLECYRTLKLLHKDISVPNRLSNPCSFRTGNSYYLSPKNRLLSCIEDDNEVEYEFTVDNVLYEREQFPYIDECSTCKVFPLCMGGCQAKRQKGISGCIPEKIILDDLLKLVIEEQF
ncbi:radical SAM protein [Tissierella sp. MB52-C2]|uniref:radical SAM protein n=1 Tax=Tissierella sp. MB52-C2 TaxID=3070999 RepID=UPI00280B181B|nr:radical SAM protein [Tissierella sp. MB52-C2]WMM25226.1 radical SAM protein [Tissierella sp. MB52-C2]